jgi:hypothetical protein
MKSSLFWVGIFYIFKLISLERIKKGKLYAFESSYDIGNISTEFN